MLRRGDTRVGVRRVGRVAGSLPAAVAAVAAGAPSAVGARALGVSARCCSGRRRRAGHDRVGAGRGSAASPGIRSVRSARSVRRARWPAASGTVSGSPRRLRCGRPRRSPHRTSRLGRGSGTGRPRARRRPSRPMIDNSATARRTPEPARKLGWRLARSVTSSLPSRWAPTRRVNAGLGCATSSRLRTLSLARVGDRAP